MEGRHFLKVGRRYYYKISRFPEAAQHLQSDSTSQSDVYAGQQRIYHRLEWRGKRLFLELIAPLASPTLPLQPEDNKESLYEIHFSLTNRVGFDQTDNYLDPNAQLGTQIEMNQAPTGIGWNNIEARRWLVDYYKREQTTDGKNDIRLFYTLWYDGAASDFPEYPNQLIYGKPWNSDWGNRVFIKKYSTDASPLYYWNDNNFRALRYADMLLLYAEALNELGATPSAKAIECLNRVLSANI